jgi:hypothetical protein
MLNLLDRDVLHTAGSTPREKDGHNYDYSKIKISRKVNENDK